MIPWMRLSTEFCFLLFCKMLRAEHLMLVLQNGRAKAQDAQAEDQARPGVPRVMRLATDELVPALNEHVRPFPCIMERQVC